MQRASLAEYNVVANVAGNCLCFSTNSIIRYNYVHHCNVIMNDGGGIYGYGTTTTGALVTNNIVHDVIGGLEGTAPGDTPSHGVW